MVRLPHNFESKSFVAAKSFTGGLVAPGFFLALSKFVLTVRAAVAEHDRNMMALSQRALIFLSALLGCIVASAIVAAQTNNSTATWSSFAGNSGNWTVRQPGVSSFRPSQIWNRVIGEGRSSLVADSQRLFAFCGNNDKTENGIVCNEFLVAVERETGEEIWRFESSSRMFESQETFSGSAATPQATPALDGNRIFFVGFTGRLHCLETDTGKPIWESNLVSEHGADPVQFGFSASPVVAEGRLFVTAAGADGGLLCLNRDDGAVMWKAAFEGASYATPVIAELHGRNQVIVVSETELISFAVETGSRLWSYQMPKPEMTNVPTPLIIDEQSILVAGQGTDGTRRLQVTVDDDSAWRVSETWHNRKLWFFYCNWLRLDSKQAIGCTDKFMAAFDLMTGEITGRWRGFGDANLLKINDQLLAIGRTGRATQLIPTDDGLIEKFQFPALAGRCWTPPTVAAGMLYVRTGDEVACFQLATGEDSETELIENTLSEQNLLRYDKIAASAIDPVEQIVGEFNRGGPDAAMALYEKLRNREPSPLEIAVRLELANLSEQQQMIEIARKILSDAVKDFPDSVNARRTLAEFTVRHSKQ